MNPVPLSHLTGLKEIAGWRCWLVKQAVRAITFRIAERCLHCDLSRGMEGSRCPVTAIFCF